jgi:hypothetical protein
MTHQIILPLSEETKLYYQTIKQLAKENGLKIADLCALAPKNDPFFTGRPAEKVAAEWFAALWHGFGYQRGIHLRRMHYQLVSQDPPVKRPDSTSYENTQRDWDYLNEASKWARYLNLVSPEAFVDRRNPEAIINAQWHKPGDWLYDDPTPGYEVVEGWPTEDEDEESPYIVPQLPQLASLSDLPDLPVFEVIGYTGVQQTHHLEVWCEKTTMNDVLLPLCKRYGANLITGAGEMSITSVVDFLQRVRQAERAARIIYISDFDPAGLGMPISVARKVEYFQRNEGFDDLDIRLHPVALNAGQVQQYNLPRVPVKDSDLRKANWEATHGEGQVELDALEALHPGTLTQIVEEAILQWYDPTLEHRAWRQRRELATDLDKEREAVLSTYQAELAELHRDYYALVQDFAQTRARFSELVQGFQPELDIYTDRLATIVTTGQDLYNRIARDLEQTGVNLDDYRLPQPQLPPESDRVLYSSDRDHLAQLERYKSLRFGDSTAV